MNGMFGGKVQSSRGDCGFIFILPRDESRGYCHVCPLRGIRLKLALMPVKGGGAVEGVSYPLKIRTNLNSVHPETPSPLAGEG